MATHSRYHAMAGTVTPIYHREESLPTRESCALYRASPARACWGQNGRSHRRKYSAGWETPHVFPILQYVFLEDLQPSRIVQECTKQFAAAQQATGHPIAVAH